MRVDAPEKGTDHIAVFTANFLSMLHFWRRIPPLMGYCLLQLIIAYHEMTNKAGRKFSINSVLNFPFLSCRDTQLFLFRCRTMASKKNMHVRLVGICTARY